MNLTSHARWAVRIHLFLSNEAVQNYNNSTLNMAEQKATSVENDIYTSFYFTEQKKLLWLSLNISVSIWSIIIFILFIWCIFFKCITLLKLNKTFCHVHRFERLLKYSCDIQKYLVNIFTQKCWEMNILNLKITLAEKAKTLNTYWCIFLNAAKSTN